MPNKYTIGKFKRRLNDLTERAVDKVIYGSSGEDKPEVKQSKSIFEMEASDLPVIGKLFTSEEEKYKQRSIARDKKKTERQADVEKRFRSKYKDDIAFSRERTRTRKAEAKKAEPSVASKFFNKLRGALGPTKKPPKPTASAAEASAPEAEEISLISEMGAAEERSGVKAKPKAVAETSLTEPKAVVDPADLYVDPAEVRARKHAKDLYVDPALIRQRKQEAKAQVVEPETSVPEPIAAEEESVMGTLPFQRKVAVAEEVTPGAAYRSAMETGQQELAGFEELSGRLIKGETLSAEEQKQIVTQYNKLQSLSGLQKEAQMLGAESRQDVKAGSDIWKSISTGPGAKNVGPYISKLSPWETTFAQAEDRGQLYKAKLATGPLTVEETFDAQKVFGNKGFPSKEVSTQASKYWMQSGVELGRALKFTDRGAAFKAGEHYKMRNPDKPVDREAIIRAGDPGKIREMESRIDEYKRTAFEKGRFQELQQTFKGSRLTADELRENVAIEGIKTRALYQTQKYGSFSPEADYAVASRAAAIGSSVELAPTTPAELIVRTLEGGKIAPPSDPKHKAEQAQINQFIEATTKSREAGEAPPEPKPVFERVKAKPGAGKPPASYQPLDVENISTPLPPEERADVAVEKALDALEGLKKAPKPTPPPKPVAKPVRQASVEEAEALGITASELTGAKQMARDIAEALPRDIRYSTQRFAQRLEEQRLNPFMETGSGKPPTYYGEDYWSARSAMEYMGPTRGRNDVRDYYRLLTGKTTGKSIEYVEAVDKLTQKELLSRFKTVPQFKETPRGDADNPFTAKRPDFLASPEELESYVRTPAITEPDLMPIERRALTKATMLGAPLRQPTAEEVTEISSDIYSKLNLGQRISLQAKEENVLQQIRGMFPGTSEEYFQYQISKISSEEAYRFPSAAEKASAESYVASAHDFARKLKEAGGLKSGLKFEAPDIGSAKNLIEKSPVPSLQRLASEAEYKRIKSLPEASAERQSGDYLKKSTEALITSSDKLAEDEYRRLRVKPGITTEDIAKFQSDVSEFEAKGNITNVDRDIARAVNAAAEARGLQPEELSAAVYERASSDPFRDFPTAPVEPAFMGTTEELRVYERTGKLLSFEESDVEQAIRTQNVVDAFERSLPQEIREGLTEVINPTHTPFSHEGTLGERDPFSYEGRFGDVSRTVLPPEPYNLKASTYRKYHVLEQGAYWEQLQSARKSLAEAEAREKKPIKLVNKMGLGKTATQVKAERHEQTVFRDKMYRSILKGYEKIRYQPEDIREIMSSVTDRMIAGEENVLTPRNYKRWQGDKAVYEQAMGRFRDSLRSTYRSMPRSQQTLPEGVDPADVSPLSWSKAKQAPATFSEKELIDTLYRARTNPKLGTSFKYLPEDITASERLSITQAMEGIQEVDQRLATQRRFITEPTLRTRVEETAIKIATEDNPFLDIGARQEETRSMQSTVLKEQADINKAKMSEASVIGEEAAEFISEPITPARAQVSEEPSRGLRQLEGMTVSTPEIRSDVESIVEAPPPSYEEAVPNLRRTVSAPDLAEAELPFTGVLEGRFFGEDAELMARYLRPSGWEPPKKPEPLPESVSAVIDQARDMSDWDIISKEEIAQIPKDLPEMSKPKTIASRFKEALRSIVPSSKQKPMSFENPAYEIDVGQRVEDLLTGLPKKRQVLANPSYSGPEPVSREASGEAFEMISAAEQAEAVAATKKTGVAERLASKLSGIKPPSIPRPSKPAGKAQQLSFANPAYEGPEPEAPLYADPAAVRAARRAAQPSEGVNVAKRMQDLFSKVSRPKAMSFANPAYEGSEVGSVLQDFTNRLFSESESGTPPAGSPRAGSVTSTDSDLLSLASAGTGSDRPGLFRRALEGIRGSSTARSTGQRLELLSSASESAGSSLVEETPFIAAAQSRRPSMESMRSSEIGAFLGQETAPAAAQTQERIPGRVQLPVSLEDIEMQIEPSVPRGGGGLLERLRGMLPSMRPHAGYSQASDVASQASGRDIAGWLAGGTGFETPAGAENVPMVELGNMSEVDLASSVASEMQNIQATNPTLFERIKSFAQGMLPGRSGAYQVAPSSVSQGVEGNLAGLLPGRSGSYDLGSVDSLSSSLGSGAGLLGNRGAGRFNLPQMPRLTGIQWPSFGAGSQPAAGEPYLPMVSFKGTLGGMSQGVAETSFIGPPAAASPASSRPPSPMPSVAASVQSSSAPSATPSRASSVASSVSSKASTAVPTGTSGSGGFSGAATAGFTGVSAVTGIASTILGGLTYSMMKEQLDYQKELARRPVVAPVAEDGWKGDWLRDEETGRVTFIV